MVALSKAFRKASLSLTKEQVSRSAKSATSSRVSSHLATRMKTDPGFEKERLDIANFAVGSKTSLAHKRGSRGEIYSARWKLMLISDQAKDVFVKNCLEGGGSMSPFQPLVYNQDLE